MSDTTTEAIERCRTALGFTNETIELDAYLNLWGALIDIRHDNWHADSASISTIERVLSQLSEAKKILNNK